MKKQLRFALTTLALAGLSAACVNHSKTTSPEPIESKAVESSFHLFPAPDTQRSTDGSEDREDTTRTSALGEPVASHPRRRTAPRPRPSVRTQLRQSTLVHGVGEPFVLALLRRLSGARGSQVTHEPLAVDPRVGRVQVGCDQALVFDQQILERQRRLHTNDVVLPDFDPLSHLLLSAQWLMEFRFDVPVQLRCLQPVGDAPL